MTGANATNNLRNVMYNDPCCHKWNDDGSVCLKCSYHYYMDSNGACQAISDYCQTWNETTGACTSCYKGYGDPVNGVCPSTAVGVEDDYCADYGYIGKDNKWNDVWIEGCRKVCKACDVNY